MKKLAALGIALFAGFMASAWMAMLLADLGRFRPWWCIGAGLLATIVVLLLERRIMKPAGTEDDSPSCFIAVVVMAAGFLALSLPPSEMILGGWDPGVYLHTAAAVAAEGSLRIADPDLSGMTTQETAIVARNLFGVTEPFGGMRVVPDGRTSPEFHHLYPSLLAIVYSFGGIQSSLQVNAFLAALSILLVYLLASQWAGAGCAMFAALLMAINPAQVWQSRFPTAEPLTQVLLLGAFILLPRALAGRSAVDAVLVGAAFGLALLARYDTILVLVPLAAVLVVMWEPQIHRRNLALAVGTFALCLVHLHYHQKYVAPYYTPMNDVVRVGVRIAGALVAGWIVASWLPQVRLADRIRRNDVRLGQWLAVLFALWALFTWFVRAKLPDPGLVSHLVRIVFKLAGLTSWWAELAGEDAQNMYLLTAIFGSVCLALALYGVVAMILRARAPWQKAWLYSSVCVLVLLVTRVFNDHFLMWVSRRFVPVVLPLLCVGAAYGIKDLFNRISGRHVFSAMGLCVALMLASATMNLGALRSVVSVRDWPGLIAWYEELSPSIPRDALIYCDQPGFAAPLRYLYRHHAFELQLKSDDRRAKLAELMASKITGGRDVWFLSMDGPIAYPSLEFEPIGAFPLHTQVLNSRRLTIPADTKPRGGDFMLYHVHGRG